MVAMTTPPGPAAPAAGPAVPDPAAARDDDDAAPSDTPSDTPRAPPPRAAAAAAAAGRTALYCALIFAPVLCGVMLEDTLSLIRSWAESLADGSNWSSMEAAATAGPDVDTTLVAKVTAMAVLGVASLTLGLIPLKLVTWLGWDHRSQHRKSAGAVGAAEAMHNHGSPAAGGVLLSAMLCFGGGVLLSTTFVHMLPEVQENFAELEESGAVTGPLAHIAPHLLMCAGFFIMYLVEELVHMYLHWRSHGKHSHGEHGQAPHSVLHNNLAADPEDIKTSPIKRLQWNAQDLKPSMVVMEYDDGSEVKSEVPLEFRVASITFSNPWGNDMPGEKQYLRVDAEKPCCKGVPKVQRVSSKCHKVHHDHLEPDLSGNLPDFMAGANHHSHAIPTSGRGAAGAAGGEEEAEDSVVSALRGLLIVLALSVHELFEGLAVGLEESASNVWYMLLAVACHKLVIAFCIGVELVAMRTKVPLHVLYVATFALVSPLGIGSGILITANYSGVEGGIVPAFLQGLATGTLLYVVFFEILERQRACGHSGIRQYIAVLLGFLVMLGMSFIGGHHHHHHHGDEALHVHQHDHDGVTDHLLKTNYTVLHAD